ncbi:MAG TPA: uroporphyrinogen-III synthase [Rhodocyclaceae bacterium]|nr:uroporphyrinogen-III synthase [Rhodocyclaceae bacterium]
MPGPLAGRTIAVTRPEQQALDLGAAIVSAGGTPFYFPLLEISDVADKGPLHAAGAGLAACALAIFISPNAVSHALPALLAKSSWPPALMVAAVGPGTARALADFGVDHCIAPSDQFDSEGLLALPQLQASLLSGRRVVIFRGDGGRELLADTLRERGAVVECISCYQRRPPADGFVRLALALQAGRLDAMTLSSSEGLRYLLAGLDPASLVCLQDTPVFVPHARIAASAISSGLQQVVLTKPADTGILEGLCAYNWPRS